MSMPSCPGYVQEAASLPAKFALRIIAGPLKVLRLWQNASGTLISMLGAYVVGKAIFYQIRATYAKYNMIQHTVTY
jgi:hypothetical protein